MSIKWFDIERLIHSIKTSIACLLGIAFGEVIGFHASQWIVITIIVVMCAQIYVGSVLQKGYLRFLGTLIGCLFAVIAIIAFGNSDWITAATIGISSFLFSYIATAFENLNYACTLGGVTTAIIMLGQTPTVTSAAERFLEISIGILIATLISQFVLPIHARTHLRRTQVKTLEQIREYYTACIITHSADNEKLRYQDFDENLVKLLSKQRQLASEAIREPLGASFDAQHCIQLLQCEKEIVRSIDFMHNALKNLKHPDIFLGQFPTLQIFNDSVLKSINTIVKVIEAKHLTETTLYIPSMKPLKEEISKKLTTFSYEELIYIDGFLFSSEILANSLAKLTNLFRISIQNAAIKNPSEA